VKPYARDKLHRKALHAIGNSPRCLYRNGGCRERTHAVDAAPHAVCDLNSLHGAFAHIHRIGACDRRDTGLQRRNAERGQWTLQQHLNYTHIGRKSADFPGGLIPDRSLNGTPELAYGLTEWWEIGFYAPFAVSSSNQFLSNGGKIRNLFVVPDTFAHNFADRTCQGRFDLAVAERSSWPDTRPLYARQYAFRCR
jgi:hypothetical protein